MKFVIRDNNLERNGQKLSCPFSQTDMFCGDWCPLFAITADYSRVNLHCAHTHLSYPIDDVVPYSGN